MAIRSQLKIYSVLEKHLQEANQPLTVSDLIARADVRKQACADLGGNDPTDIARVTEKLSDTLGFMWRKGVLTRYPAPRTSTSLARYAYAWATRKEEPLKPIPTTTTRKHGVIVSETDDGIMIEFEKFMVYVRPK